MKKEDRRISMTKRMLKEALTDILKEKDIYHISIRELCEKADVNRTTFYKYYGSQFDLFTEMEYDFISFVIEALNSGEGNIEAIIIPICKYLEENIDFARLIINNNVDREFTKKLFSINAVRKSFLDRFSGDSDGIPFEYAYNFCTYGSYSIVREWIQSDERESCEELGIKVKKLIIKTLK
ncbi:MAG: TetR/AcrR family transcriptional regulator [Clostridia bacterium]|nr:TetR/AcrR family transcriptional regulator [Clostridia bacterium]